LKALRNTNIRLIVVTHYPENIWPKGDIPIGINRPEYSHIRDYLLKNSAIIIQGTRPLAGLSRSLIWNATTPETIIDKTLEIFGMGVK